MTGPKRIAVVVASLAAGAIAAQALPTSAGKRERAVRADEDPAARGTASSAHATARSLGLLPADGPRALIRVDGLGKFVVRCPADNRLKAAFVSGANESLTVVIDGGREKAITALVDPGERLRVRADDVTSIQKWQFAHIVAAYSLVSTVSIASSPGDATGSPGCVTSAYALGPTRGK